MNLEVNFGFQYYSPLLDDNCFFTYHSSQIESTIYYLISILKVGSSPLLHGNKVNYL